VVDLAGLEAVAKVRAVEPPSAHRYDRRMKTESIRGVSPVARVLLALGVAAAATACHGGGGERPRSVILISIDTLRADHLGCYGHPLPTSPNLDAFAAQGTLFDDAYAPSPWTLPSHVSLLTGLYPTRHGVRTTDRRLADAIPSLATLLAQQGFETGAIVNGVIMRRQFGLAQGFGTYEMVPSDQSRTGAGSRVTDAALRWLGDRLGRRVFLFLHYYDVHSDYRSLARYERMFAPGPSRFDGSTAQLADVRGGRLPIDEEGAAHVARLYDAGIRQLDEELGRLFSRLRETGWLDDSAIVVTSDHGEEFLEHGGVLHGHTHYQELMRIPLILWGPTIPVGARILTPVSLVDVVPTLLALLGMAPHPGLDGVDLRALWKAPGAPPGARWLFAAGGPGRTGDTIRSVREGRHKLVLDKRSGRRELYDLIADAHERNNLAGMRPEVETRLSRELSRVVRSEGDAPYAPAIPGEVREQLQQLGYE
jgi:arylsulfatase A-like enzyme